MLSVFAICSALTCCASQAQEQVDFDTYFQDQALRFEFFLFGNKSENQVVQGPVVQESSWPGPRKQLVFPFP